MSHMKLYLNTHSNVLTIFNSSQYLISVVLNEAESSTNLDLDLTISYSDSDSNNKNFGHGNSGSPFVFFP